MSTIATNVRAAGRPVELPGVAGWLTTSDHKRLGRVWLATSLVGLLVGAGLLVVVAVEGFESGQQVLTGDSLARVQAGFHEVLVLGFLAPFAVGLATALVPLQIGAPGLAFPRLAALALWTHVVSLGVLLGAYLAGGGVTASGRASDLHIVALGGLAAALSLGLVCVVATAATWRAQGMTLSRAPSFTWAVLVGGGALVLASSVLVGRVIESYIHSRYADVPLDPSSFSWFWSTPQLGLLAVPFAGIALEVVPVLSRSRYRVHTSALVVLAAMAILGVGVAAQPVAVLDDVLAVLVAFASVLPPLVVLALLGDTVRRGSRPTAVAALMSVVAVLLLLVGATVGAIGAVSGLDLVGTSWQDGQFAVVVLGAGVLGAASALWYWAPKLYGYQLSELAGTAAAAAVVAGSLTYALAQLANGLLNDLPAGSASWTGSDITTLHRLALVGAGLVALGAALVVVELLRSIALGQGFRAGPDPWQGATLEWATSSPPPAVNFTTPVAVVTSATPLWDEVAEVSR